MKDYRLNSQEQRDYIIEAKKVEKQEINEKGEPKTVKTLEVRFADGKVYTGMTANSENVKKILEQQEAQAKAGVENLPVFQAEKRKAEILTGATVIAGPVVYGVADAIATAVTNGNGNSTAIGIGVGLIALAGLGTGIYKLVKNCPKVKELKKIKFRNKHREDLDKFTEYPNSLVGVPKKTGQQLVERHKSNADPYSILYIDDFSQKDLETIVDNIDREKTYQFTYAKKPTPASKK